MSSILFVCLGNICRSPLAEGIAKDIFEKKGIDIKIDSAGTGHWHIGKPPCVESIKIASENGVDISMLRARAVIQEDKDRFNFIIAMDDNNIRDLKTLGFENILKLGDFGCDGEDVPDPYFFDGYEGFDKVYSMINRCLENFINIKY